MKIDFSLSVPYVPEWRGNKTLPETEQIKCSLTVLDMGSLMSLVDAFTEIGITGEVDTDNVSGDKIKPVLEQFGSLLPEHVTAFDGLFDAAGKAITVEDVVKYPRFLNLALELLMKLSEISSPSDDDVGNSNEPPALEQAQTDNGSQTS